MREQSYQDTDEASSMLSDKFRKKSDDSRTSRSRAIHKSISIEANWHIHERDALAT